MQKAQGTQRRGLGHEAPPSPGCPEDQSRGPAEGAAAVVARRAGLPAALKDAAVSAGSDVRLRVVVSGTPQPSLSWFRMGSACPPPAPEPGCLWLPGLPGPRDAGVYSCRAQNGGARPPAAVLTVLEVGGNAGGGGQAGGGGRGCSWVEKVTLAAAAWWASAHPAFSWVLWLLRRADPGVPVKCRKRVSR